MKDSILEWAGSLMGIKSVSPGPYQLLPLVMGLLIESAASVRSHLASSDRGVACRWMENISERPRNSYLHKEVGGWVDVLCIGSERLFKKRHWKRPKNRAK